MTIILAFTISFSVARLSRCCSSVSSRGKNIRLKSIQFVIILSHGVVTSLWHVNAFKHYVRNYFARIIGLIAENHVQHRRLYLERNAHMIVDCWPHCKVNKIQLRCSALSGHRPWVEVLPTCELHPRHEVRQMAPPLMMCVCFATGGAVHDVQTARRLSVPGR